MSQLSTKDVVLGLLIGRTTYGYALQQELTGRLGFLGLAESCVYKTLDRLEADGYVEQAGQRRSGRAVRVLYRTTPDGVARFKHWISEASDDPPLRDELHAKLVLAAPDDLPQLLEVVEAQADACAMELNTLESPASKALHGDRSWKARAQRLVDDYKARRLESIVDWLSNVAQEIEECLDDQRKVASTRLGP